MKSEKQLNYEDFKMQLDAALRSFKKGHFATARGELNGAIMISKYASRMHDREKEIGDGRG